VCYAFFSSFSSSQNISPGNASGSGGFFSENISRIVVKRYVRSSPTQQARSLAAFTFQLAPLSAEPNRCGTLRKAASATSTTFCLLIVHSCMRAPISGSKGPGIGQFVWILRRAFFDGTRKATSLAILSSGKTPIINSAELSASSSDVPGGITKPWMRTHTSQRAQKNYSTYR
jgi:hypothetical protein